VERKHDGFPVAKESDMKRINLVRTISFVLLLSTLFFSCATPIDQQVVPPIPAEPVEVDAQSEVFVVEGPKLSEAAIEMPPRYMKYPPVIRYGDFVGLVNETGYSIKSFDLFNDRIFLESTEKINMFSDDLGDGQRVVIHLTNHPALYEGIQKRDGSTFSFNAADWDGNLYWGEWNPSEDAWNLVLSADHMISDTPDLGIESFGPSFVIANKSPNEMVKADDFGRDLLRDGIWEVKEEFTFKVSPVLVENNQVLHLYVYAYLDNEYHKEWNVSDGWHLTFSADGLSVVVRSTRLRRIGIQGIHNIWKCLEIS
jgi:hypothetical protein